MKVAGQRMSLFTSSMAMTVWGVNMATMKTAAAAIAMTDIRRVSRCAASRSRSSSDISASRSSVPPFWAAVAASAVGASALTS